MNSNYCIRTFMHLQVDLDFGKFRRFVSKGFDKEELSEILVSEILPFSSRFI